MVKRKNKMKKEQIGSIDYWDFDGGIDDIIAMLQKIRNEHNNYSEVSIEINDNIYEGSVDFTLFGYRPESKEEKKKRLEEVRRRKEAKKKAQEEKEAEEIERLKKLLEKYKDKI
jgi:hypothetical protein